MSKSQNFAFVSTIFGRKVQIKLYYHKISCFMSHYSLLDLQRGGKRLQTLGIRGDCNNFRGGGLECPCAQKCHVMDFRHVLATFGLQSENF